MRCGNLPEPRNGDVRVSGNKVGATAMYTCDAGFRLKGDGVRECQSNGKWSGSELTCQSNSYCMRPQLSLFFIN